MGNPLFAVQIALLYKKEPILSFIYSPHLDEFYFAEKNKGAFLNNKKIKVSKKNIDKALLTYCHGNKEKHIKHGEMAKGHGIHHIHTHLTMHFQQEHTNIGSGQYQIILL